MDTSWVCGFPPLIAPADLIIAHYERRAGSVRTPDRRAAGWNDKCWIDRFASLLPADASVLDIGCGGGAPVAWR